MFLDPNPYMQIALPFCNFVKINYLFNKIRSFFRLCSHERNTKITFKRVNNDTNIHDASNTVPYLAGSTNLILKIWVDIVFENAKSGIA